MLELGFAEKAPPQRTYWLPPLPALQPSIWFLSAVRLVQGQPAALTDPGPEPVHHSPVSCAHKGVLCCLPQAQHRLRFLAQGPASRLDGKRGSAWLFPSQQSVPWWLRLVSGWLTGAPLSSPGGGSPLGQQRLHSGTCCESAQGPTWFPKRFRSTRRGKPGVSGSSPRSPLTSSSSSPTGGSSGSYLMGGSTMWTTTPRAPPGSAPFHQGRYCKWQGLAQGMPPWHPKPLGSPAPGKLAPQPPLQTPPAPGQQPGGAERPPTWGTPREAKLTW